MTKNVLRFENIKSLSKLQVELILVSNNFGYSVRDYIRHLNSNHANDRKYKKSRRVIIRALEPLVKAEFLEKFPVSNFDKREWTVSDAIKNNKYFAHLTQTEYIPFDDQIKAIKKAYRLPADLKIKAKTVLSKKEKSDYYYALTERGMYLFDLLYPHKVPVTDWSSNPIDTKSTKLVF